MHTAIILAGGKGERLRPVTENLPKCMVPVLGSPLISFQLKWLKTHGIRRVVICCGYLHEVLQSHLGDGSQYGLEIDYIVEENPLGRGGALKQGLRLVTPTGPVLALNGDHLTNLDLSTFYQFHTVSKGLATLVSVPLVSPYGIVEFSDDDTVSGFKEKPQLPYWINAGIYIFEPEILDLMPDKGDHETQTFPALAQRRLLKAFKTNCFWRTIDTVKDLSEVRSQVEELMLGAFFKSNPAAKS